MSTLEERVAALERRLDEEARLRASVDEDLSSVTQTLKAQNHLIQALAITQSQHTEALERLETGVGQVLTRLNRLIEREGRA